MNEQLEKALTEFLMKMINGVEQAGEFVVGETPDVIQQALIWFAVSSGLFTILAIGVIVFGVWIAKLDYDDKYEKDHNGELLKWRDGSLRKHENYGLGIFVGAIISSVGIGVLVNSLAWLKILIAPKWFIVSEMSKLI